jgi:hypothetical protein
MYPSGATYFRGDYYCNKKLVALKKAPNTCLPNKPIVGNFSENDFSLTLNIDNYE